MSSSYIVVRKNNLDVDCFETAANLATFLWGKDSGDLIIIKKKGIIVELKEVQLDKIEKELEDA